MLAVLDSSAVLALIQSEPGAETVAACLPGAFLSTVNLAEVLGKLCDQGMGEAEANDLVKSLCIDIVPFDVEQARLCADLRRQAKAWGLSLGDRACLALAISRRLPALTTDRVWAGLPTIENFTAVVIRGGH